MALSTMLCGSGTPKWLSYACKITPDKSLSKWTTTTYTEKLPDLLRSRNFNDNINILFIIILIVTVPK